MYNKEFYFTKKSASLIRKLSNINLNDMNAKIDYKFEDAKYDQNFNQLDKEIEKTITELQTFTARQDSNNKKYDNNAKTLSDASSYKKLSKITKEANSPIRSLSPVEHRASNKPTSKYFFQLTHDNIGDKERSTPKKDQNKTQDEKIAEKRKNEYEDYFYYQETERKLPRLPTQENVRTYEKKYIEYSDFSADTQNDNYSKSIVSARDHKQSRSVYDKEMLTNYSKPAYAEVGYVKQFDNKTKRNYHHVDIIENKSSHMRIEDRLLLLGQEKDKRINDLRQHEDQKLKDLASRKKSSVASSGKIDGSISPRISGENTSRHSPRPDYSPIQERFAMDKIRNSNTPRQTNRSSNRELNTISNGEELNYVRMTNNADLNDMPENRETCKAPRNSKAFIQAIENIQKSSNQMLEYLLHTRNSQYLAARSTTPVKHSDENRVAPFTPKINTKSKQIASKLGDATERILSSSTQKVKELKREALVELNENELTFKPKINSSSKKLDKKFKDHQFNGDNLHRWDQLYLMKDKYQIDKQLKKIEKEKSEMENEKCTFHPHINKKSNQVHRYNYKLFELKRESKSPLTERMKMWQDLKDKKLSKEREDRERKEMNECTFTPRINKSPQKLEYSLSPAHFENMNVQVRGLDQHYERIDLVNRRKKEIEYKQSKNQGLKWKNKITIPQEFNFRLTGNIFIPSLHSKRSISPRVSPRINSQRSYMGTESFSNERSPVRIHENYSPPRLSTRTGEYQYENFEKRIYRNRHD